MLVLDQSTDAFFLETDCTAGPRIFLSRKDFNHLSTINYSPTHFEFNDDDYSLHHNHYDY